MARIDELKAGLYELARQRELERDYADRKLTDPVVQDWLTAAYAELDAATDAADLERRDQAEREKLPPGTRT